MLNMRSLFLVAVLALASWSAVADSDIARVEPPSWWQGFKQTELQLLIYGNEVGKPGTVMTYFPDPSAAPRTNGTGEVGRTAFSIRNRLTGPFEFRQPSGRLWVSASLRRGGLDQVMP